VCGYLVECDGEANMTCLCVDIWVSVTVRVCWAVGQLGMIICVVICDCDVRIRRVCVWLFGCCCEVLAFLLLALMLCMCTCHDLDLWH